MDIKPFFDNVLIKLEKEEKRESGLVLPESADMGYLVRGRIEAVGEGAYNENGIRNCISVFPGDRVLFNRNSGDELDIDGEKFVLICEREIRAKLGV